MLLQHFGFREEPFGVTPDPRYLYPSQTHREALASIRYGFQSNRGFTAIIAPPGMGKTTLLRHFLEDVRETTCCEFLFDIAADCEPREFIGYILREIGITPANSSSEMHEQLSDALVKETRAGRKFVVVIDEAQNLSDGVLERVRLLTNFETSQGKLMHVVLSGQPQLAEKLQQSSLDQLRQRISTVCRLEPLSAAETDAYIEYRLKLAGYGGKPLFTKDALDLIAEASQGIPRIINNLCFNSLSLCCALNSKRVDSGMVAEAISDLRLTSQSSELASAADEVVAKQAGKSKRQRIVRKLFQTRAAVATILVVGGALGMIGFIGSHTTQARKSHYIGSNEQTGVPAPSKARAAVVAERVSSPATFVITVEPHRGLGDISVQYLGGYDLQRLRQIQTLNPTLTDPDHIEAGQKLLLPGSAPTSLANDTKDQSSERTLP